MKMSHSNLEAQGEVRAMGLEEISKAVKKREKFQGLGRQEGTQPFSLVKEKSYKDQGEAREVGREPGECGVPRPSVSRRE